MILMRSSLIVSNSFTTSLGWRKGNVGRACWRATLESMSENWYIWSISSRGKASLDILFIKKLILSFNSKEQWNQPKTRPYNFPCLGYK